jgi:hypothetical protein
LASGSPLPAARCTRDATVVMQPTINRTLIKRRNKKGVIPGFTEALRLKKINLYLKQKYLMRNDA